jgi:hypothetical protein
MLNATISTEGEVKNYFKFYLPDLSPPLLHPMLSQSVTLTGKNVTVARVGNVDAIRITVSFPNAGLGFDSSFFNFKSATENVDIPDDSIVEFYSGEVTVTVGAHL